jgi:hypothetical protein
VLPQRIDRLRNIRIPSPTSWTVCPLLPGCRGRAAVLWMCYFGMAGTVETFGKRCFHDAKTLTFTFEPSSLTRVCRPALPSSFSKWARLQFPFLPPGIDPL